MDIDRQEFKQNVLNMVEKKYIKQKKEEWPLTGYSKI